MDFVVLSIISINIERVVAKKKNCLNVGLFIFKMDRDMIVKS